MSEDKRVMAFKRVMADIAIRQDSRTFYGDPTILERIFKVETDDEVISIHTRQLGGCSRCDRESLYDFSTR